MPRRKVKRTKLIAKRHHVLIHGFGINNSKDVKIAEVASMGPLCVALKLEDDLGSYIEKYSLVSGVRTCDIGAPSGWRISLRDSFPEKHVAPTPAKGSRTRKLAEEQHKLSDTEVALWEMYSSQGEIYFKFTRRRTTHTALSNGEVETRDRDYPALVPAAKVADFLRRCSNPEVNGSVPNGKEEQTEKEAISREASAATDTADPAPF